MTDQTDPAAPDPQQVREIAREAIRNAITSGRDAQVNHAICAARIPEVVDGTFVAYRNAVAEQYDVLAASMRWPDELCLAPFPDGNHRCLLEPHSTGDHAVRTDRGMVTWEGNGQTNPKPDVCVCGDPNCMPYCRPVHEQMNTMRIRLDKTNADFTKSLLEQVCELATELDELKARREDGEDERDADVRAVGSLLEADDEDVPKAREYLRARFAGRIDALIERDAKAGGSGG